MFYQLHDARFRSFNFWKHNIKWHYLIEVICDLKYEVIQTELYMPIKKKKEFS